MDKTWNGIPEKTGEAEDDRPTDGRTTLNLWRETGLASKTKTVEASGEGLSIIISNLLDF